MGFGDFLRGIAAQVNPFDHGATYGTYNPPKKRQLQPGDLGYQAPTPRVVQNNQVTNVQQVKTQRPQNLFAGLNADLTLPSSAPTNSVQPPQPAQPPAPHPSFWHGLGQGIKIGAQTAAGVVSNIPEVGLAAGRAATGIVQGAANLPSMATHAATYVPRKIAGDNSSVNRALSTVNRGVDTATNAVVNRPFNYVNRGIDIAAKKYESAVPTAAGGASAYRATQIPLNVLAGLLTLGAGSAAETGNAGKLGQISRFFNKPITSNPDNLIARTGQSVTNRSAPVVQAVNSPFKAARTGITKLVNGRSVPSAVDAGEIGNVLTDAQLNELTKPPTQVPVNGPNSPSVRIPVQTPATDNPFINPMIRELGGDATAPGTMPSQQEIANRRFTSQPTGRSDQAIEGVTPRPATKPFSVDVAKAKGVQDKVVNEYAQFLKSMGEGNGTQLRPDGEGGYTRTTNNVRFGENKGKRMTKQDWADQARKDLESGRAEPGHQQAFNDANNPEVQSMLDQQPATPGKPVVVKSVKGIPVTDQTVIPTEPGKPGTVRATTQTSPSVAKSEAVASAPTVASPPALPKETQAVLDNPKGFSKRQVKAARNQLRLAKKLAQTKADTKAVVDNMPETSVKPEGNPGFVSTGEFRTGSRGNVTESASKQAEAAQGAHDTTNLSHKDVLDKVHEEVAQNGSASPESIRNLKAIRDSGRLARTSPEFKAINTEYNNAISHYGRGLSLTDRTARTSATGDQLTNRFVNKLLVYSDHNKLTDAHIKSITDAENAFTDARDSANAAAEQFKATGSQSDFDAWKAAQQRAEDADRQAKITEFHVSKDVLKGNKNPDVSKVIQDAEKNAGVYSMDAIDANMLSGTGTMVRNFVNTLFPRIENKAFGKVSSLAVRKLAPIGGSSRRGAKIGAQIGKAQFKAERAARKEGGVGFIRRNVTAGNTLGEKNIQSTAYAKGYDHYKQLLKKDGYAGKELNNRAEFMARSDPEGYVKEYEAQTLQANALSSLTHSRKYENDLADYVQKKLAGGGFGNTGQQIGRGTAKAVTRVAVGFPTVIARSLIEGAKRATLGIPEAGASAVKFAKTGDKEAFASDLAKSIQHAGTGASLMILGHALAKAGMISGPYPTDKSERERWTAEGKQPDSINIGGQWFQIPGYLGGFALPLMLGSATAGGHIKDAVTLQNAWQTVLDASPVDNIQSTLQILTGGASESKVKNAVTSLARAATPAGSFVAELAKLTDPTKNDTTTKDALHNILDSIAGGIPGLNNKVNTIPATDKFGNEIKNPNKIATVLGAQGSEQKQGAADVQQAQNTADQTYSQLKQAGVLDDKNLNQLIDPKVKAQIDRGEPLKPEQVTKIQKDVTKGVSATDDSAWRESGNYTTDKAALQTKLQLLQTDPTTKPSEISAYKTQIKRDDLLHGNNIAYDDYKLYKDTSTSDWRKMGDSTDDSYDPATYQKLWALDQLFSKNGAGLVKDDVNAQKYSAKKPGTGHSNPNKISTDFGKLSNISGAPSVQKYDTISPSQSNMPTIGKVIPNIVHKISAGGGI